MPAVSISTGNTAVSKFQNSGSVVFMFNEARGLYEVQSHSFRILSRDSMKSLPTGTYKDNLDSHEPPYSISRTYNFFQIMKGQEMKNQKFIIQAGY